MLIITINYKNGIERKMTGEGVQTGEGYFFINKPAEGVEPSRWIAIPTANVKGFHVHELCSGILEEKEV